MMKDRYGRTIDYMRISITDRCNLRCRYCMPQGIKLVPMENILTFEEIEQICRAAAKIGICKLKITGGEPLVRLGCPSLIRSLKKIPGIEQVTMTTNGVLLSKYMDELVESGLDAVNISLDTLDEKRYQEITGRDELKAVLESISLAVEGGLNVKINSVLQKGSNDQEWKKLIQFTMNDPVDVRFIEMMPIGYGRKFETVYNEEVLEQLYMSYPRLEKDEKVHGNGPAVYYKLPGAKGSIGFISAMHGKFCSQCNRLRLTSQGMLKPCLCYEDHVDLAGILKTPDYGQLTARLSEAIQTAVHMKPEGHKFEDVDEVTEHKRMVEIGG